MSKAAEMREKKARELERFKRYKTIRQWTNYLSNKGTEQSYLAKLQRFCDWIGKDPDALIDERFKHLKSEDIRENHEQEEQVAAFLKEMESSFSPHTLASYAGAIRSFYMYNRADLKLLKSIQVYGIRKEKVPTREEVAKMCHVSSTRDRAIILFQYQSGLRNDTIAKLQYGDVKEDLEKGQVPVRIHIMPEQTKCRIEYDTFISRDAIDALNMSMDERRRGVAVRGAGPERITDESPLFRSGRGVGHAEPITSHTIAKLTVRAAVRAGVVEKSKSKRGKRKGYTPLHAHCLRKAFQTTLEASGVPSNWVKYMMGHTLPRVEGAYSKPSVKQLQEAYAKAEPSLSIGEAKPVLTSEEIGELVERRASELVDAQTRELKENQKILASAIMSISRGPRGEFIDGVPELVKLVHKLEKPRPGSVAEE